MFAGGNANFAVVYTDGDREINVGTVDVDPAAITFKHLLPLLSRKIGLSPHHFSVYLAAVGTDRKIPITAKVDLATAMHLDGGGAAAYYFFLVKRSSSSKRSKKAAAAAHPPSPAPARDRKKTPTENVMLLRRAAGESQLAAFRAAAPPFMDRVEFEMRMMNLRMERERFLMNMAMKDANVAREASNGGAAGRERNSAGGGGGRILICEECLRAKRTGTDDGGFHPCVYDEVTVGFRSPAGPISRPPAKNTGQKRP